MNTDSKHYETAETLAVAKVFLEEAGWAQGVRRDHYGRMCMDGALCCASPNKDVWWEGIQVLHDTVNDFVTLWNDEPGRTKAQVLRAFDKAIKRELKLAKEDK
jgi:hypothetical protein